MFNMIKAEVKRLFYTRGFWISLAVFVGLYVLCIGMQAAAQQTFDFSSNTTNAEPGIYLSVDKVIVTLNSFVVSFGHSFGLLVMGIYLASFVSQEYSSGFVKNTAALKNGRVNMIISKLVVSIVVSLLILVISYVVGAILGSLFVKGFKIDKASMLLSNFGILMVVSVAFFSLDVFVSTLFRNKTSGIVMTFLISSGILLTLFQGLLNMVKLSSLGQYSLSSILMNLPNEIENISYTTILISFMYIVVYNILSIGIVKKRDL